MLESRSNSPASPPDKKEAWMARTLRTRLEEAKRDAPPATDFEQLLADGRRGKMSSKSNSGKAYELLTELPKFTLYEDNDLLVINKPPHLVSVASTGGAFKIGAGEIVRHLEGDSVMLANRLDRNTSGLLVFGKNFDTLLNLFGQFADKSGSGMKKVYVTLLEGRFENSAEQRVDARINDKEKRRVQIVREDENSSDTWAGRSSTTLFKPLSLYETQDNQPVTLARAQIVTGRTHQIRVVAADCLKYPVVGDSTYNVGSTIKASRQMLHAFGLRLQHPRTGDPMIFEAPWPPDFNDVLRNLSFIKDYK